MINIFLRTRFGLLTRTALLMGALFLAACGSSSGDDVIPPGNNGNNNGNGNDNGNGNGEVTCIDLDQEVSGFTVSDGRLLDSNGNDFIMRGVNYPYAWFRHLDNEQHFADMASVDSNTVRVVLATGAQWNRIGGDEVADIIAWSKANNMVAMLEVHDATGWPQQATAAHPQTAVDYWLDDDIREAIEGNEAYVIINIANEPLGNFNSAAEDEENWIEIHVDAVEQLRCAGLYHTLVVDAPNWGQDWRNIMRSGPGAEEIFAADPLANVVFSVHMYDVYGPGSGRVEQYFDSFLEKGLPMIVGEFAADHGASGDVDVDAILALSEVHGTGYLGWSWSGNTSDGGLNSLDITINFDVNDLSPWGARLIDGENGIRDTSEPCSCFTDN